MPYNLRKRPAPEPSDPVIKKSRVNKTKDVEPSIKKPRVKSKENEPKVVKPPTKKSRAKVEKSELLNPEPEVTVEDTEPQSTVEDTKPKAELEGARRAQYSFGVDGCGELGLGRIGFTKKAPVKFPIDEAVQEVVCGPMHTISLTVAGKVYTSGCNDEGVLGRITDGDSNLESTPALVPLPNPIIKVTAGDSHCVALSNQSQAFVWGNFRDEHGSVGLTPDCNGEASFKPIQLSPSIKFQDIASGSNHILLLDTEGVVYSFGVGAQGQLGRLTPEDAAEPITAENRELLLTPQEVSLKAVDPQRPFVCDAIYAGNNSSFATNTDKKKNRLAGWGLNNYYQLGYKGSKGELVQYRPKRSTFTCSTRMKQVACGQHHSLFLTHTGKVYSAGRHDYGMLGLGKVDKEVCPAKRIDSFPTTITNIDAGINTSFGVSDDGKLYAWGMSGPQLGLSCENDILEPTIVKSLEEMRVLTVSSEGEFTSVVVEG